VFSQSKTDSHSSAGILDGNHLGLNWRTWKVQIVQAVAYSEEALLFLQPLPP
jgi:hypothetical protein